MTTTKISYSNSSAIPITLNSLSASATAGRQSTLIDNTSNLYDDALVTAIIKTAGVLASPNSVNFYIAASEDGTNFEQDSAVMGASDAAYTIDSPTNLRLVRIANCSTTGDVYNVVFSVAQNCGGIMPRKWIVVAVQNTGAALAASGNSMSYSGITFTSN